MAAQKKTTVAKTEATEAKPSWFDQAKTVAAAPATQEFGKAVVTGIGVAVGYMAVTSIYHAVAN